MRELNELRSLIIHAQLSKLEEQYNVLLSDDYPYADPKLALESLKGQLVQFRSKVEYIETFSPTVQSQICLRLSYIVNSASHLLGMITRSNSMRNAFELYYPFRKLCQSFFDEKIQLLISSEWNYTPFTYPMNLEELPNFIIIGLPATESSNVLIFPAAGHELGHSLWLKLSIGDNFSSAIVQHINDEFRDNRDFNSVVSAISGAPSGSPDIFVDQIRTSIFHETYESCIAQIEELFCDFIGLLIFGKSYLYAFQYLVSPGDGSSRSKSYPDLHTRASIIERKATELGITFQGYSGAFATQRGTVTSPYDNLIIKTADRVRDRFVEQAFSKAHYLCDKVGISIEPPDATLSIIKSFECGLPIGSFNQVGTLFTAAWEYFSSQSFDPKLIGPTLSYVSDLVLKSVEAKEFQEQSSDA